METRFSLTRINESNPSHSIQRYWIITSVHLTYSSPYQRLYTLIPHRNLATFTSQVSVSSYRFSSTTDVLQGSVLSSFLYFYYIDGLPALLRLVPLPATSDH
ncbi:MAG: hypothetical protein EXX96DRAFT_10484 [Benjaminiella poitrasii]|nr:MAG: hypothetical protein EXX96DRAFT_10484 [Benjaminiella poitrasii]